MNLPMMIVIALATFGFMFYMRRRLNTQFAHMTAGALAPRLGMQVVDGDPAFNLATMSVLPSVQNTGSARGFLSQMAATSVGGTLGEFKLRLAGQPYGSDAELVVYVRQDYQPGLTTNTTTTWSDVRLTVRARAAIAPFDLRLRKELTGLETRRHADEPRLPAQRFADPALDARYAIEAHDPRLPAALIGALAALPPHLIYVHVVGNERGVSFVMTPAAVNASAVSFEQILHALASVVALFEGRPMPGALASAA
jgi:hypothetical protein